MRERDPAARGAPEAVRVAREQVQRVVELPDPPRHTPPAQPKAGPMASPLGLTVTGITTVH